MPAVYSCRSAYFFSSERDELQRCLRERRHFEPDIFCLLFGLWTHSSSVVIHLVLSNVQEIHFAKAHKLNCLGYYASEYSNDVDSSTRSRYPSMSQRETITIEWNQTKQGKPFSVFARSTPGHSHSGKIELEVKILDQINPFRQVIPRHHRSIVDNIESESRMLEDDNVEQESLKTLNQGKIKGTFSDSTLPIIKSIENRIKTKLADGNSAKSKTLPSSQSPPLSSATTKVVQLEFKHHEADWWIRFDKLSKYDVNVEINHGLLKPVIHFKESLTSKNIISAVKSKCDACQSSIVI